MDQASGFTCVIWSPNHCFCRLVSSVMRSGGLWASPTMSSYGLQLLKGVYFSFFRAIDQFQCYMGNWIHTMWKIQHLQCFISI